MTQTVKPKLSPLEQELLAALKELTAEAHLNLRGGRGDLIDNAPAFGRLVQNAHNGSIDNLAIMLLDRHIVDQALWSQEMVTIPMFSGGIDAILERSERVLMGAMIITATLLKRKGACPEQVEEFERFCTDRPGRIFRVLASGLYCGTERNKT